MKKIENLVLASFVALGGFAGAEQVYRADFSSYAAGDNVKVSAAGDADTASKLFAGKQLTGQFTTQDNSAAGMTDGLSLKATASAYTGPGCVRFQQTRLGDKFSGVMVVSFDFYASGTDLRAQPYDTRGVALGDTGTKISIVRPKSVQGKRVRATLLVNNSGAVIALPGNMGELQTGNYVLYVKDGETYTKGSTIGFGQLAKPLGGFEIAPLFQAADHYYLLDNIGVWNSVDDKVNGQSVLELPAGTLVNEP